MTTVVLVDDQALIRVGIRGVLESAGFEIVAEAADGRRGAQAVSTFRPDIVLMDLRMPDSDGIDAITQIRADPALEDVRILVLTTFDGDRDVIAAMRAGADGFISKSAEPDDLIAAVARTASGEPSLSSRAARAIITHLATEERPPEPDAELAARIATLTPRERDVVAAAAIGADNSQIAAQQFISPFTVKTHLNRAMVKLAARDRGQLVAIAYQGGLIAAPGPTSPKSAS